MTNTTVSFIQLSIALSRISGNDPSKLYQKDYAVFREGAIEQLRGGDRLLWGNLLAEYEVRWPIASGIKYEVEATGAEWGDGDEYSGESEHIQCLDAIVFPCSLMFSMPDAWQKSMGIFCEALSIDDLEYYVLSCHKDPSKNRNYRWTAEGERSHRWESEDRRKATTRHRNQRVRVVAR